MVDYRKIEPTTASDELPSAECVCCGKLTSDVAGNPMLWPIYLCVDKQFNSTEGKPVIWCSGCVHDKLFSLTAQSPAQAEQEPVADSEIIAWTWADRDGEKCLSFDRPKFAPCAIPLFAAPPTEQAIRQAAMAEAAEICRNKEDQALNIDCCLASRECAEAIERAAGLPAGVRVVPVNEGELWSFFRKLIDQGTAIWQDYDAGKYPTYEHYSARLDEAARERVEEYKAMIGSAKHGD